MMDNVVVNDQLKVDSIHKSALFALSLHYKGSFGGWEVKA